MIRLHTLGTAEIEAGAMRLTPASARNFALLLYIGAERGRHISRATLQSLIYPDQSERNGAHSLRQLIYRFRQAGVPIEGSDTVFVPIEKTWLDVAGLGAREGLSVEELRGMTSGLLPGYAPGFSETFTEWLDGFRARLGRDVQRILLRELRRARAVADWSMADCVASAALALDPLNEEATLARAEALAATGAKASALAVLDAYAEEVGQRSVELRVPATILRRRISEQIPSPSLGSKVQLPFVGREKEMTDLGDRFRRACRGETQAAMVVGQPGIGKSRLVAEFCGLIALGGARIARVALRQHDTHRPLAAFADLAPQLLEMPGALGCSPSSLAAIRCLTNQHNDRADGARPLLGDGEAPFYSIASALSDLLGALAAECPVVLVVEDAHWLDVGSLRVLTDVISYREPRRLMLILTTREPRDLHLAVRHADRLCRLTLGGLTEAQASKLALAALKTSTGKHDADLCAWLARTSAGNPFFLETLVLHYLVTHQRFAVPPTLSDLLTQRIDLLDRRTLTVLQACVVLGKYCTIPRLTRVLDLRAAELAESLHQLESGHLVSASDGILCGAHWLVSEAVIRGATPASLRLLRFRAAETLDGELPASPSPGHIWDCAELWRLAGETDRALSTLRACAQHALAIGRPSDAAETLNQALELTSARDGRTAIARELISAADAARELRLVLRGASALAHEAREHDDIELAVLGAQVRLLPDAAETSRRLLECVSCGHAEPSHRISAGRQLMILGFMERAGDFATQAFAALTDVLQSRQNSPECEEFLSIYHSSVAEFDLSIEPARRLLTCAATASAAAAARLQQSAFVTLWRAGCSAEAIAALHTAYESCRRASHRRFRLVCASLLISTHSDVGDDEESAAWHRIADDVAERYPPAPGVSEYATARILAAIDNDRLNDAETWYQETARATDADGYRQYRHWMGTLRFCIDQETSNVKLNDLDAAALMQRAGRRLPGEDADLEMRVLWRDLVLKNRLEEADELLTRYLTQYRSSHAPLRRGLRRIVEARRHTPPLMPFDPPPKTRRRSYTNAA
jgi:DNA-binding SARP family transcriptional activator